MSVYGSILWYSYCGVCVCVYVECNMFSILLKTLLSFYFHSIFRENFSKTYLTAIIKTHLLINVHISFYYSFDN